VSANFCLLQILTEEEKEERGGGGLLSGRLDLGSAALFVAPLLVHHS
jgi:hypothetical protein